MVRATLRALGSAYVPTAPQAVWQLFAEVPAAIRRLWARCAGTGAYHDICMVEAIGPLLLLCTYPSLQQGVAGLNTLGSLSSANIPFGR